MMMGKEEEEEEGEMTSEQQRYDQIIATLPTCRGLFGDLRNYHGFWYPHHQLRAVMAFRDQFKPRDTDVLLVSPPKSGTTWLKALAYATVYREDHGPFAHDHPLLRMHPHDCVPMAEDVVASELERLPSPRLLSAHMGLSLLPDSALASPCKIVYICRNPKDMLVSHWHYCREMVSASGSGSTCTVTTLGEMYCRGESAYGPVWDHQLGYWGESLRRPDKVLFLKYEDLTEEPAVNLRRLAGFVGRPFSEEEEREGVVDGIVRLCSLDNLRGVEANQTGHRGLKHVVINNSSFFRKGLVGDWKNHLSPDIARRLDAITVAKLRGSGLTFRSD